MRASVRCGEANEGGASEWIDVRRALSHEIGSPERAFGSSRNSCSFGGHAFIRIAAVVGAGAKTIAKPAERQAGGLRYTHDVPAAGNGVAKRVQAAFGIERRTICCGENHAGSSNRGADDSRARDAHADGPGSLIACSGDDCSPCAQPSCRCSCRREFAANFLRFVKLGEKLHVDAGFVEDFARPCAMGDVQHQRARSVRDINGGFAREAQADVVLRQHDFADALPILRFVFADPKKFGEREVCEWRIAGELDKSIETDGALELFGLRFGALVAPDESRADDLIVFIKQDSAVHLAGETDGGDGIGGESGGVKRFARCDGGSAPPVARILFCPAWLRAGEIGVFFGARGEDRAASVEDNGAGSAGADVDAEDRNNASF